MYMKRFVLILLVLLCGISLADVKLPSPAGFVNDFAGVLTAPEKQELEGISQALMDKTGAELAVAVVETVEPLDSKLYAVELFEKWGIGEKSKDNGVLVLLAIKEQRIEIEVGYGLEGVLPDALAGRILDNFALPNFKEGKFGVGLIETSKALSRVIAEEEIVIPVQEGSKPVSTGTFLIYVIIGVIIIGILTRRAGSIILGIFGAIWGSEAAGLFGAIAGGLLGLFFGFWGLLFLGKGGGGRGFGGFGGGRSGGGGAGRGW